METEATNDKGYMAQCPNCPRRIWFPRNGDDFEVQEQGDFYALHTWSNTPELSIQSAIDG